MSESLTIGPFTWDRDENRRGREHWSMRDSVELVGMYWNCQDYGPPVYPGSPFTGWRYGSGGPFGRICANRDEAMRDCIPYLIEQMEERTERARARLARLESALAEIKKGTQ